MPDRFNLATSDNVTVKFYDIKKIYLDGNMIVIEKEDGSVVHIYDVGHIMESDRADLMELFDFILLKIGAAAIEPLNW